MAGQTGRTTDVCLAVLLGVIGDGWARESAVTMRSVYNPKTGDWDIVSEAAGFICGWTLRQEEDHQAANFGACRDLESKRGMRSAATAYPVLVVQQKQEG